MSQGFTSASAPVSTIANVTNLQNELDSKANLSGATFSGALSGANLSFTSISGGTLYSGSTNLYNIFLTSADGNDITRVQPGTNIITGGTGNSPIISLIDSPSINNLISSGSSQFGTTTASLFSGGTISGGTIYSGSTNLYNIFQKSLTVSNGLTLTGVALKWGGALTSTTSITGAQTLNLGTSTLRLSQLNGYSTTQSIFFVGDSATTGSYSSLALYGASNNYTTLLQTTDGVNLATVQLTPPKIELIIGAASIFIVSTGDTIANNGTTNSVVIDDPNSKGAVYAANYIANFTPESLVTKRYVDSNITGVTSGITTGVKAGSNITTGGTFFNPIINLATSPSINGLISSGSSQLNTATAVSISGGTISASTFFLATEQIFGKVIKATAPINTGNTWVRTTDYEEFNYDAIRTQWLSSNEQRLTGARASDVTTTQFLRYEDGVIFSTTPFMVPYNATITKIVMCSSGVSTWQACITTGTTLGTDNIAVLGIDTNIYSANTNYNVSINSGQTLYIGMSGTSIPQPRIDVYFKRRG